MPVIFFKNLILGYISGVELIFTDVYLFKLTLMNSLNSQKKLKKETKLMSVKQKRERKHNFIEVENEITYVESIVIPFRHFTIDVAYLVLVICVIQF